jgi:hypothetical protein
MILSAKMLVEEFGGIESIANKLYTNLKTGIDGSARDKLDRMKM